MDNPPNRLESPSVPRVAHKDLDNPRSRDRTSTGPRVAHIPTGATTVRAHYYSPQWITQNPVSAEPGMVHVLGARHGLLGTVRGGRSCCSALPRVAGLDIRTA